MRAGVCFFIFYIFASIAPGQAAGGTGPFDVYLTVHYDFSSPRIFSRVLHIPPTDSNMGSRHLSAVKTYTALYIQKGYFAARYEFVKDKTNTFKNPDGTPARFLRALNLNPTNSPNARLDPNDFRNADENVHSRPARHLGAGNIDFFGFEKAIIEELERDPMYTLGSQSPTAGRASNGFMEKLVTTLQIHDPFDRANDRKLIFELGRDYDAFGMKPTTQPIAGFITQSAMDNSITVKWTNRQFDNVNTAGFAEFQGKVERGSTGFTTNPDYGDQFWMSRPVEAPGAPVRPPRPLRNRPAPHGAPLTAGTFQNSAPISPPSPFDPPFPPAGAI
ncbi:MAG: hypothetical protein M1833_006833 [Piccolia ochrophora]|nr:MAG: hypothetical protein M1833_006833 [Piccolia ochrophora]